MAELREDELQIAVERLTPQWLAGFFDGEGCICSTYTCKKGKTMVNPRLMVTITQAEYNLLAMIALKFHGSLYSPVHKKSRKQRERKPVWMISLTGKAALPLLEYIAPYVILKRKLVEWAIEMARLTPERGCAGRGGHLPVAITERRRELANLVKEENNAGMIVIDTVM